MHLIGLYLSRWFPGIMLWLLRLQPGIAFVRTSPTVPARLVHNRQLLHLAVDGTSLLSEFSSPYTYCLEHHYFQTQSATAAAFSCLGDAIAQATEQKSVDEPKDYSYDFRRGMAYFGKGIGGGIMWACWFDIADTWSIKLTHNLLSERLGIQEPSFVLDRATRTTVSILLEQFLGCPIFFALWDIPLPALLRGTPPHQIPAQIENKLGPLLIANAKLWTPVNIITYNIPLEFRVLFSTFADIIWQAMNAAITSKGVVTDRPDASISLGTDGFSAGILNEASLDVAPAPLVEEVV